MSSLKQMGNLYYLYYYTDVKKMIFDFKFKNRKDIAKDLSVFVKEAVENILEKEKIDMIISIPINKKRFLERGYNQVDELLKSSEIDFVKIERIKNTKYMYKIKGNLKREENVKKAFKIEGDYFEKTILIVDDIVTTGATLKELERELKERHKVKKVIFFTLAAVREYFK
ncbi:MAG: ComF family protein [Cetobacterium sp.]|uniref:ComF family protein n=1 Tax=unclassified Cetobacterium TaxID=2630983 RepID=UPI00068BD254|nr:MULTISPECIES: ComF family protein [unclassified Cetobacterium]